MRKLKAIRNYTKVSIGILIPLFFLLWIMATILYNGVSSLEWSFLFDPSLPEGEGLFPVIINTLVFIGLTLLIAVPIGIGSAIYLTEYAKDSPVVTCIRMATESLAGIPSIIYGLFGFLFFVLYLKWSWSILAGVFTLSMMILPTVIRSSEEALKSVPASLKDGSYALGGGKFYTIRKILLPYAKNGIIVGVLLSVGRIVGESAALILTAGTVVKIPKTLMNSGASMSVYMYTLTIEGSNYDKAYATSIVLLVIVLIINICTKILTRKKDPV